MLKALAFIVQEEHEGGANNVDEEYEVAPDNVDEEDEGAADNVDEEDEEAADNVEEDEGAADNVDEEQKLYEGATVNNLQAVVLILAFSLRHFLSDRATGDLLRLVQAFLPVAFLSCLSPFLNSNSTFRKLKNQQNLSSIVQMLIVAPCYQAVTTMTMMQLMVTMVCVNCA